MRGAGPIRDTGGADVVALFGISPHAHDRRPAEAGSGGRGGGDHEEAHTWIVCLFAEVVNSVSRGRRAARRKTVGYAVTPRSTGSWSRPNGMIQVRLLPISPPRMRPMSPDALTRAFERCERHLWGLCFRMTGSSADADDLVQETFARVIERPPADLSRPLKPWLVSVAMNLSRDLLRRRRRRGYVGPFLASAIEPVAYETESTAGRYDRMESVSQAFLFALEELTPQRRAVLLLRDVFDYSVAETAEALGMSESSVKTTHHRARRQMQSYEDRRAPRVLDERYAERLQELFTCLAAGDDRRLTELLADDVRAVSDGGGDVHAALRPIVGRDKVIRFFQGLLAKRGMPASMDLRVLNGAPAIVADWPEATGHDAPRAVTWLQLDGAERVQGVFVQLSPSKLTALPTRSQEA